MREVVATGNLVVATFDHATSRELAPQLHTHAVVANVTRRDDGVWRALHNPSFFRDKMHLGRVYRSELARELQNLGYAPTVTDPERGLFEVQGLPQDLLEAFSQRRAQVEERFAALKASGSYPHASDAVLRHQAALDTRRWKGTVDRDALAREVASGPRAPRHDSRAGAGGGPAGGSPGAGSGGLAALVAHVVSEHVQGRETLVLTATNRDRRELNARLREALVQAGAVRAG